MNKAQEAGLLALWHDPEAMLKKLWEHVERNKRATTTDCSATVCRYMDAYKKVMDMLYPVEKYRKVMTLGDVVSNEPLRQFLQEQLNMTAALAFFDATYIDFWKKHHKELSDHRTKKKKDSEGALSPKEAENYMLKDEGVDMLFSKLDEWYEKDPNMWQNIVAALTFAFGNMKFCLDYALSSFKDCQDADPVVFDPAAYTFHIWMTNRTGRVKQKFSIADPCVRVQLDKFMALREKQGKRHLFVRKKKTGVNGDGVDFFRQGVQDAMIDVLNKDIRAPVLAQDMRSK
ncbi:hypothetical protein HDV00_007400 [Rhizophlyctis rosea]|nr:hypothetical protein HDV00_007400 [Rhizophlyctis rosea]